MKKQKTDADRDWDEGFQALKDYIHQQVERVFQEGALQEPDPEPVNPYRGAAGGDPPPI